MKAQALVTVICVWLIAVPLLCEAKKSAYEALYKADSNPSPLSNEAPKTTRTASVYERLYPSAKYSCL
jgi:hypothetical protein